MYDMDNSRLLNCYVPLFAGRQLPDDGTFLLATQESDAGMIATPYDLTVAHDVGSIFADTAYVRIFGNPRTESCSPQPLTVTNSFFSKGPLFVNNGSIYVPVNSQRHEFDLTFAFFYT
ncbi:MAG: hypothetical protein ACI8Y7_000320 [Candidatus Woesearchaeota archaeon]|jgi:hypothetical protein